LTFDLTQAAISDRPLVARSGRSRNGRLWKNGADDLVNCGEMASRRIPFSFTFASSMNRPAELC
jgi:hypothetical protein